MLVYVFPVVIQAFRTTPKSFTCWCEKVRIATKISEIWKTHLTVCKKSLKSALDLRNLVESKPQGNTSDKRLVIVQHWNNKNNDNANNYNTSNNNYDNEVIEIIIFNNSSLIYCHKRWLYYSETTANFLLTRMFFWKTNM